MLLRQGGQAPDNWFFNGINWIIDRTRLGYKWTLNLIANIKGIVLLLFVISLGITYWIYTIVPTGFLPEEDQGYIISIVKAPEGVSLNYTEKVLEQAEAIMKGVPEIENVFAIGGFSFSGTTPENGIIFSTLKPWKERSRPDQSSQAIIGKLLPQLLSIKDAFVIPIAPPAIIGLGNVGGFEFQLQDKTNQGFPAMEQAIGQLLGKASTYPNSPNTPAQESKPPQLVGLRPDFSGNTPQLSVEIDRAKASSLQVSLQDIFNSLQTFLGSRYVNDFNQFGRTYRVYVQADSDFRSSPDDINKLYVRSASGNMIPLGNLVKVTPTIAPSTIYHYNLFRSAAISGNTAPGVSSGQAIKIMETVAKETLPQGFGFEWSGLSLEEISSGGQAYIIFGLGLVFVFLVLAAQYENYIDPTIIMLTVPLAILGALVFVMLRGIANDVYTQIGFVMLIGMASKNAILIVEFANQLRATGLSITKAVIEASQQRLRPILMTALSTIIGTFPLAIASGAGAASRKSLGTAVIGGMCVATVLSLFIVPVLYITIKTVQERLQRGLYKPALAGVGSNSEPETIDVEIVSAHHGLPDRIQSDQESDLAGANHESTSNPTINTTVDTTGNGSDSSHAPESSKDPDSQETPKT
jgi:hydrophobic/amphiphilic exporter-1 (mainly G- bacteria), HAE1 family